MRVFLALSVAVAAATSGCSWLFVDRLPPGHDGTTRPQCTTSMTAPVFDGVFAALGAAGTVYFIRNRDAIGEGADLQIAGNVLDFVVHAAAGATGNAWVNSCRQATARYDLEHGASVVAAPAQLAQRTYHCTSSPTDSAIGACGRRLETCLASQRQLADEGIDVGPCTEQSSAVCFSVVVDGVSQQGCAPTVLSCRRNREQRITRNPALDPGECEDVATRDVEPAAAPTPFCYDNCSLCTPLCFATMDACRDDRSRKGDYNATRCRKS